MGALRARDVEDVVRNDGFDEATHAHVHAHETLSPHGGRYEDILGAIGHTPLVEIPRMSPNPAVRILAKLEFMNPTGSVKDRVAKYLVEDLETRGLLGPDSIILEPTSGNTGIALAMIGRRRGYRVALVMPDNVTNERRQMAALFGAEVIDSPGALGSNGAIALAKHLVAKDPRFVMPYQYGNEANPLAHYETTGPEVLADCPEVGSRMMESSCSSPRRSRSSMRYFATRSLTDPVGLSISSFAKMRTSGFGLIRGISTSGVCPIASSTSAYRPPWRASPSCACVWS